MEIKQLSPVVTEIRIQYGEPAKFLLSSDYHFDNPKCLRDKLFKNLQEAADQDAKIFCFGDLFCFMQGRYDPRGNKKDIRPEHNVSNYVDAVIDDTVELLKDYPFALISRGNHETSILKRLETDVTKRFVEAISTPERPVGLGGYHGFVRIIFHQNGGNVKTFNLYFHHGKWGGVVTKGIQGNSRFASIVDADIVVTGHTHNRHLDEGIRYVVDRAGRMTTKAQHFVKCGTYKEEFTSDGGWAIETIVMPKNIGGWWLEFEGSRRENLEYNFKLTT